MRKIYITLLLVLLSNSMQAELSWENQVVYKDGKEIFVVSGDYTIGRAAECFDEEGNISDQRILVASQGYKTISCCRRRVGHSMMGSVFAHVANLATWSCCCPPEESYSVLRVDLIDIVSQKSIVSYEKRYENAVEIKSLTHKYEIDPDEIVVSVKGIEGTLESIRLVLEEGYCKKSTFYEKIGE